jgi:hypothetical protein
MAGRSLGRLPWVALKRLRAALWSCLVFGLAAWTAAADAQPRGGHWSFRPIGRPHVPHPHRGGWTNGAIDSFVLQRLDAEGIEPSPGAIRETLIRRVTLDLIGLPPPSSEVEAFVNDMRPNAYEHVVERLLASPHYGERWARPWLDVAHYADSDGYLTDQLRPVAWRFRQWVVDALNHDMSFDQFTIEQLAGDLLPDSTTDQKIATGFLRQTLSNREGGADVEEFRVMQVKDRASTVGTVWLGLTVGCAQCHDHKYDPISQREFYELYAFFDAADEVNIDAPLRGEFESYRQKKPEYDRRRHELIASQAEQIAKLQRRWEMRLLEANADPGRDYRWDRHWEILGLIWGQGLGEGQLEGQEIVKLDPSMRTPDQRERIFEYFLRYGADIDPQRFGELRLGQIKAEIDTLNSELPQLTRAATVRDTQNRRKTFVQNRGVFNDRGDAVDPSTPDCLPALRRNVTRNRLALAEWLVARDNPLTARVTVNRVWQEFFGRGLVRTSEDFGSQGDRPTHPDLLDWLASDFMEQGWRVKRLHKQIVCSAVYRQSSHQRPELQVRDPNNTLLARQSGLRLSAEAVRDCTLAVSGLLARRLGGPSACPPQSDSVVMGGFGKSGWNASTGENRYRRALYTFIKRATPFPQLATFDAPNARDSCTRRERSNTPLQALTLLNDPLFFEASQALAERTLRESDGGDEQRIDYSFRMSTARMPSASERDELLTSYRRLYEILQQDPQAAALVMPLKIEGVDGIEAGAWTGICSVLLNLHEFITRD